jgi:hypothetical protein
MWKTITELLSSVFTLTYRLEKGARAEGLATRSQRIDRCRATDGL